MAFRFRLETVLKLRRQRENDGRRVVAARLREISAVTANLDALEGRLWAEVQEAREDAGVQASRPIADGTPAAQDELIVRLRRHRLYMGHLRRCIEERESHLAELRRRLHEEQRVLTEAAKQVKVIEKLRERQFARFQETQRRAEMVMHDETALNLYRRARQRDAIGESAA
ncbi:MAG TPA: flagellar FliJ family protein [Phycisphaerae bacterium]|jgi:flagellar export protein FliJ